MANVEINVRTQLIKIAKDLDAINKSFGDAQDTMQKTANAADDSVKKTLKSTQNGITGVGVLMKRAVGGLLNDFKALGSVVSTAASFKMSSMVAKSAGEIINLSDTVRKLSGVFRIADKDQASFIQNLSQGMGDVGLGSQAAANSLTGLAQTQVRGGALISYSKTAGMLASQSSEQGQEGAIAQGLAGILQARGIDVNNVREMRSTSESINRAHNTTGARATEIISNMNELFSSMNSTIKKTMTPAAAAQLTAISAAGGKGGVDFIRDMLGMDWQKNAGLRAQGFSSIFTANGLNNAQLSRVMNTANAMGGGDAIAGLTNMGLSEDQAKGLKMLYDNLGAVDRASVDMSKSTKTLAAAYEDSKTASEAWYSSLNRVAGYFSGMIASMTGAATNGLKTLAKSDAGAIGVTGLTGILTAVGAGIGLKGLGAALGFTGAAQASAFAGMLGNTALALTPHGVALAGGAAAGAGLASFTDSAMKGTDIDNRLIALFTAILQRTGSIPETVGPRNKMDLRVYLDDRNKELKPSPRGSVGPHQGVR